MTGGTVTMLEDKIKNHSPVFLKYLKRHFMVYIKFTMI